MERLLVANGHVVCTYTSAEEFLELANPDNAACLILDIHLGGISGIELMQDVLQAGAKIPVVLITGTDNERTRQAAWAAGCSAFLQKPISAKVLMDQINSLTARR
jgi:FixJ family two-component response regulator